MSENIDKKVKFGGRPKGATNLKTRVLGQDLFAMGIDPVAGLKKCLEILDAIEPRHQADEINIVKIRIELFGQFLPYVYSKLNPVDPKVPNPWDAMNSQQKLEALKQYQVLLEKEVNGIKV